MADSLPSLTECEWAAFRAWCAALEIPVPAALRGALGRYRALLEDWNSRINLTGIRDPRAVLIKHFLDSLTVLPHLAPEAKAGQPLLDIGSGAGFPGLVLKLARPELPVTIVEARGRKVAFLEQVRRTLQLPTCTVLHHRLGPADPALPRRFGTVVSRAFRAPAPFLALGRDYLQPGGRIIAMLGPGGQGEGDPCAAARAAGAADARLIAYALPEGAGARRLLLADWPGAACST